MRPATNLSVIWDCVDLEQFRPEPERWKAVQATYQLPDRNQHFVILTLGRLSFAAAHKGYDRLLQVFHQLSQEYDHARLVIAGKGDMLDALKATVAQLGLSDKVCFTGMVHEENMAALYSYAHVFSLVSDRGQGRGEGIPLTPLEAMACRVPIVVGNHDGSQEAVFENRNGAVIDPFDLAAHQAFFEGLLLDSERQSNLAQQAFLLAHEYYDYQIFVQKHHDLLRSIANYA